MLVLNFAHPLTDEQKEQLREMLGVMPEVVNVPAQFDNARGFAEQVRGLVDGIQLTAEDWQTKPIIIIPPSLNFIAVTLIAELHGRMGYFPPVIRLKPVAGVTPPRYEVAEVISLQAIREAARERRYRAAG